MRLLFLRNVDTQNVLLSKYFIGYLHNDTKVKPLHIMLPKTSASVKSYDGQTRWMDFSIEDVTY